MASSLAPGLLSFFGDLRTEGVAIGTSEILDSFNAVGEITWTNREDFREALAATVAKSQEDRRIFDLVFDRHFFRAAEQEALEMDLGDGQQNRHEGSNRIDLDQLRDAIRDGDFFDDDCVRANLSALAHSKRTQYFGTRANDHTAL